MVKITIYTGGVCRTLVDKIENKEKNNNERTPKKESCGKQENQKVR